MGWGAEECAGTGQRLAGGGAEGREEGGRRSLASNLTEFTGCSTGGEPESQHVVYRVLESWVRRRGGQGKGGGGEGGRRKEQGEGGTALSSPGELLSPSK